MDLGLDSEEELENLQNVVKQMADRILHYRRTLPKQLKEGFALLISDETEDEPRFEDGTSSADIQGTNKNSEPGEGAAVSEGHWYSEQQMKMKMKIQLLKRKASVNATAAPILLKRIKESISKIETLGKDHGRTIDPAFGEDQTNQLML